MDQTCSNCRYWSLSVDSIRDNKEVRACYRMNNCFCCNHRNGQIAGAMGGGYFASFGTFSCNMWRIDTRNKNNAS